MERFLNQFRFNFISGSVVTEVAPVEKSGDVIVDNKLTSKNNSKAVSGQNSGTTVKCFK